MEDHLQQIRGEHPNLNPSQTYTLLSKAITTDVVNREMDFEDFNDALNQYEERLNDQLLSLKDRLKPECAEDMLGEDFEGWLDDLQDDHQDLDDMFDDVRNIACNIPGKTLIAEIVDEQIQKDYPEFHKEYLQHQQWLKTNQERLDRQEQQGIQDESNQIQNMGTER